MRTLFTILYTVAPIFLIPLVAYHKGNWWFLVGIAISYGATVDISQGGRLTLYYACYCIGFWIHNGFSSDHNTTFYCLCALWGFTMWPLAEAARMESFAGTTPWTKAMASLLPLVRVLPNIIADAFNYVFGFPVGNARAAWAYAKGIEKLEPERADSIMRQLKKGTIGLPLVGLGVFGAYSIYGVVLAACFLGMVLWWLIRQRRARPEGQR